MGRQRAFHVMSFRTRPRRGPSPGFSPPGNSRGRPRHHHSAARKITNHPATFRLCTAERIFIAWQQHEICEG